jgi:arylsulfatase A-like enzyme
MAWDRTKARWIGLLTLGLLAVMAAAPGGPPVRAQEESLPNILIIMADDMRADPDSLSMLPKMLDRIAGEGTTFNNAVATTPRCCPSRASIFSGKYVHNHQVFTNSDAPSFDTHDTMQRLLQENGYATALVGKYLNRVLDDPPFFDRWASMRGTKDYFSTTMNINGEFVIVEKYLTNFLRQKSIEFLYEFEIQDDDQPWFMMVTPYAPHAPSQTSPKYEGTDFPQFTDNPATAEKNLSDKPDYVRELQPRLERILKRRRQMLRSLKPLDDLVNGIFKSLSELHEGRRTLVLFISDNGFMWGEHGLKGKKYPYDPAIKIPFMMRWPDHVLRDVQSDQLVANIDVAPTVLEAAQIVPDYAIDGKPILSSPERDEILIEWVPDPSDKVPFWEGIWSPGDAYVEYVTGEKEYYDELDEWQKNNRLGNGNPEDNPSNQAQLSALLEVYSKCVGPACP